MFNRFLCRWFPFLAWGMLIVWLSLIPAPPSIDNPFFGWDKFQHAVAYSIFTLLAFRAFGLFAAAARRRWLKAAAVTLMLGGSLEVAQGLFTQTRTAEWSDLLADLAGAGAAYLAVRVYLCLVPGERKNRS